MAKKEIRTKYIKSLMEDKNNLVSVLKESTEDSLSNILKEEVNRSLRDMLSESQEDDSFTEEEVDPKEPVLDTETEDNSESDECDSTDNADLECGNGEGECANGTCCDKTEGDEVWDEVDDCKDDDGEYDLRGKDINTVLKVLQSMEPTDGVRIIKNDDNTATIEPDGDEQEFVIDIDAPEANEFEDGMGDDIMDSEDGLDFGDDMGDDDDMMDDIDLDSFEDGENNGDDEGDDVTFELEIGDEDEENEDDMINEGNVNLGYTDNYQKKTPMTLPSDKGEGEGDSRFDAGAPKGGANNKKRWVGTKGANNGNPYTQKTKQPMSEDVDECGDYMSMDEAHNVHASALEHNSVADTRSVDSETKDTDFYRHTHYGAKGRGTARQQYESRMSAINRQANAVLAENKELKAIAEQIKQKLNEAVVINSSLSKIIKLMTENSTTRDEKINILNRFNRVNTLNESRALYNQISGELKNAHSVNNNLMNNQLTEAKGQNKNMIVETKMLEQSDDIKQILDLQRRLMKL